MIEALFAPAAWLAGHPERAYLIALAFLVLAMIDWRAARRGAPVRPAAMFVPAAAWLLFAVHEYHRERPAAAAIPIDLYITWPLMLVLTIAFIGVWIAGRRAAVSYNRRDVE